MASIDRRRGKWRVQVRRHGHALIKTFALKHDAEARMRKFGAREVERAIDQERDPTVRRVSRKDTFASLIDLHIEDLSAHGKPIRRSKDAVLRRLRVELGEVPVAQFTRERLIRYGRQRARDRAGSAPPSRSTSPSSARC